VTKFNNSCKKSDIPKIEVDECSSNEDMTESNDVGENGTASTEAGIL
jgi:hypothetical protein